jgi:hypothetical protein
MTERALAPEAKPRALKTRSRCRPRTKITPAQKRQEDEASVLNKHWRTYFLQALAATSNVTAAARAAEVSPSRAYKARREHAAFAAQWRAALLEGYEHLEMEVLGYLRGHTPERKLDVANAIRLLGAHRQMALQERARIADEDEEAVLDSLHAKLDALRLREQGLRDLRAADKGMGGAGSPGPHD